jgi:exopolysaccharide biosynthesis polyprenyl glycosylphosphotransferase
MFSGESRRQKASFALADGLALLFAFALALVLHDPADTILHRLLGTSLTLILVGMSAVVVLWVLVFHAFDLYRFRNGGLTESVAVFKACTIAMGLTLLLAYFTHHLDLSRLFIAWAYGLSVSSVIIARVLVRSAIKRAYRYPQIAVSLVVVGFNSHARYICEQILDRMSQYEFVGFLDETAAPGSEYRGRKVLGGVDRLTELSAEHSCLEVMIVLPDASRELQEKIVRQCEELRLQWRIVPPLFRSLATGLRVDLVGVMPVVGPTGSNIEGLNFLLKRGFDLVTALLALIVASPVMLLTAAALWLTDGSPIFFRQTRIGFHGRHFELLKFRSMRAGGSDAVHRDYVKTWIQKNGSANGHGNGHTVFKLENDPRVTPLGKWLRRFSIDELPQLINVLRGEMSLIGPRPALPYELELYQNWHKRRFDAPPGVTGLWQVAGRNHIGFDDMVRLDIEYLERWSLMRDLQILVRTLPVVLQGKGH